MELKSNEDISRDFDIIISILEKSHNPKYKVDMVNRIKRLYGVVFNRMKKYEVRHKQIITNHKKRRGDITKC